MATPSPTQPGARASIYVGVFLLALATLLLEVLLTRITSVIAWYHLAFFVISLAMLGMTAGAVLVFVRRERFEDADVPARLGQSALAFALAIPASALIALALPLESVGDLMTFVGLVLVGAALATPFVFTGIALTLALTRAGLSPGVAYGVDLIGAALGCALVIPVLDVIDAPSAALLAAAIAAAAALAFARAARRPLRPPLLALIALLALCAGNASAKYPPLHPAWVKGAHDDLTRYMYTRWNTYSRVTVEQVAGRPPLLWSAGTKAPPEAGAPIDQRTIKIDGAALTVMAKLGKGVAAHDYLPWEITTVAHALRPHGPAAVIGVGGGRDVLAAVRAGHEKVVGIELNALIVDLHRRVMPAYSGIAALPGVQLVNDEARSYMARDHGHYSVIAMSLIDTWASTGAGAYSLSENGLYTVQAWTTFIRRLQLNGVLSVSRWYFADNPGETERTLALALDMAWQSGSRRPRDHIILFQVGPVSTLLFSRRPFSDEDVERAERIAEERGFNILLSPRTSPQHRVLRALVAQPSRAALHAWASRQFLDLTPPTDARPFFFNMLPLRAWLASGADHDALDLSFLGNLQATQTLLYAVLASALLTLATLVVPMRSRVRDLAALPRADVGAALAYFALIGLGFMFVEIGVLSRLSVFLGHPTLALAVVLGGLIFFTGVGSLLSTLAGVGRRAFACGYPLLPAALVGASALLTPRVMRDFAAAQTSVRVAVSVALLAAPALGMGICFPLGLHLCERMERARAGREPRLGPWLWGVNGAFSVCASGLGLMTSMVWGIPVTLLLGAACYALLPLTTWRLSR
jgi:hypothetical protein